MSLFENYWPSCLNLYQPVNEQSKVDEEDLPFLGPFLVHLLPGGGVDFNAIRLSLRCLSIALLILNHRPVTGEVR